MDYEPSIDRIGLLEVVRAEYGLAVEHLTFVPLGYAAACYTLDCYGGERYFLKLWPDTGAGRASGARQGMILPLMRAIYERGVYRRVPYPIATRANSLWATFQGATFALFPFLPGHHPPESAWPDPLWDEFARTAATIHNGTSSLTDVLPPRETFDIPFADDLQSSLQTVACIGPQDRPGLRALREMILPRQGEILAQLERLHKLQAIARTLPGPFVLCHTDMTDGNLLVDEQGQLYVLDWDQAIVATPEYDLKQAVGEGFDRFLEVYMAAGGARPLSIDRFAFYLLRRYMEDLMARLLRILRENTTEEQDRDDLEGMEMWGFAQWNSVRKRNFIAIQKSETRGSLSHDQELVERLKRQWNAASSHDWKEYYDEQGRLLRLNLVDLGLVQPPAELWQCTSLQELDLGENHLSSLPAELGQLINLEWLGLDQNEFSHLPAELAQLINLQELFLGENQLNSLSDELYQLINLQTLDLSKNQLSSLPGELGQLTNLQWLSLDKNQLRSLPAELGQLIKLDWLGLDENPQLQIPPEVIQQGISSVLAYLRGLT